MHQDIKEILLSEEEIAAKTAELGKILSEEYKDRNPLVLCVLKGASLFMTDLVKKMTVPIEMDFMAVSSYSGTQSSGEVRIIKDLDAPVEGRDILIVEDIMDTGLTLSFLTKTFAHRGAASVKICTLLLKEKNDPSKQLHVDPDFIGFTVPDAFVVGYGLDYNERYRNLPYIGVLKEEVYS